MSRAFFCCLSLCFILSFPVMAAEPLPGDSMPAADGRAVIDYVTRENDYRQWSLWPDKGELYKGRHPHGAYLTTYVTTGVLEAIEGKTGVVPEGALVVKENYTAGKELAAITVMYKKSGYNPTTGNWFWLKFSPDGTIENEGKVAGCIGCHAAVKGNDWLFTGALQ